MKNSSVFYFIYREYLVFFYFPSYFFFFVASGTWLTLKEDDESGHTEIKSFPNRIDDCVAAYMVAAYIAAVFSSGKGQQQNVGESAWKYLGKREKTTENGEKAKRNHHGQCAPSAQTGGRYKRTLYCIEEVHHGIRPVFIGGNPPEGLA